MRPIKKISCKILKIKYKFVLLNVVNYVGVFYCWIYNLTISI